jgi:NTE family protein
MADTPIVTEGVPNREPEPTQTAAEEYLPKPRRQGMALCLSGGGYRAALFHLGALRRLNEVGLLSQLTDITSVSGGSIISAHLAQRVRPWPEPGEVFPSWEDRVARPFRAFARRNIRTWPVLARWLLPWNWFRTETSVLALAAQYQRHLTGLTLADLPTRPAFIYCATDLTFGVNWEICRESIGDYQAGYASPPPNWPLGRAVAASSCFPPVFDPLPIDLRPDQLLNGRARGPQRDALVEGLKLTDGGVYDNMGLEPVWKRSAVVLVSDGGSVFDFESDDNPIRRLMRYLAVFGDQAGRLRKRWLIASFLEQVMQGTYWGIGSDVARYRQPGAPTGMPRIGYSSTLVDEVIERIRTDMDAFSPAEIAVLENHGYTLADAAIRRHLTALVPSPGPATIPHPEWMDEVRVRIALKDSARRVFLGRGWKLLPW